MRIAIIGARLAGSYASLLLSQAGHEVLLFDNKYDAEKPCGGGVTAKALHRMPWLHQEKLPHTEIRQLHMKSAEGYVSAVTLKHPIYIYSRSTLDSFLRQSAIGAGTRFHPERALGFVKNGSGWGIATSGAQYEADFVIGADGANSSVRAALLGRYPASDLSLALGFYLPGVFHNQTVYALFQESGFRGYLWSFPRIDHTSVGILNWLPETNSAELRRRVEDFIADQYPGSAADRQFYAATIPCLRRDTLVNQTVCGDNWALLGDAAGFTDAITAEGIYYALRSAELLAASIRGGNPTDYEHRWRSDFGRDLLKAAGWRETFYSGILVGRAFIHRMLQITRFSETVRTLTNDLISGAASYQDLRRSILLGGPKILIESIRAGLSHTQPSGIRLNEVD